MNSNPQDNPPKTTGNVGHGLTLQVHVNSEAVLMQEQPDELFRSDIETSESEAEDLTEQEAINKSIEAKRGSRRSQRKSVCAEVYGQYNPKGAFQPNIVPKDPQTKLAIRQLIQNNFLFRHLEDSEIDMIVNAMEIRKVKAGEMVIRQGDNGNELYVVGGGQLRCTKLDSETNEQQLIKDYDAGDYFGELALLHNAPRAASITAVTDCILYSVDRECFNHVIKEFAVRNRQIYEQFLSEVEILQSLDNYERSKLCDCLKVQIFEPGQKVISQGESGATFYLIVEGEARAVKLNPATNMEESVMEYHPKMYFGELALLKDQPRAATVIAEVS